jgi:hypothetical protein
VIVLLLERTSWLSSDGRLVVHYCDKGDPMASGAEHQSWARPAMDAVHASSPFDLIHLESHSINLNDFMNVTIPVIPSWHGTM